MLSIFLPLPLVGDCEGVQWALVTRMRLIWIHDTISLKGILLLLRQQATTLVHILILLLLLLILLKPLLPIMLMMLLLKLVQMRGRDNIAWLGIVCRGLRDEAIIDRRAFSSLMLK